MTKFKSVVKRNGTVVPFTPDRITNAIYRAAVAVGGRDKQTAQELSGKVVGLLEANTPEGQTPNIEQIQDDVENFLMQSKILKLQEHILNIEKNKNMTEKTHGLIMMKDKI